MNDNDHFEERRDLGPMGLGVARLEGGPAWTDMDQDWDKAIGAARMGDIRPLVSYVAARAHFPEQLVEGFLVGEADEGAALLCRAAGLPWESFEGILVFRSRRFGRGPGMFGAAIRIFRDTSVDTARGLLRLATSEQI